MYSKQMPEIEIVAAANKIKEVKKEHPEADIYYDSELCRVVAKYEIETDYDSF